MLRRRQRVDIRKRSFIRSARESELPIVPFGSQGEENLGRGKGQCFHRFLKEGRTGDCGMLETPEKVRELQRKLYQRAKQDCESRRKKMIGKPYSGKLNVRFDEGELEIGP